MSRTIIETIGVNCREIKIVKFYRHLLTIETYDDGVTYTLYKQESTAVMPFNNTSEESIRNE